MAGHASPGGIIDQARLFFAEQFVKDAQALLDAAVDSARKLVELTAERSVAQARRDMFQDIQRHAGSWPAQLGEDLRERVSAGDSLSSTATALVSSLAVRVDLSLVDDETVDRDIIMSRLSLALQDVTTWEYTDLRARLVKVSQREDLNDTDVFKAQNIARLLVKSWMAVGLSLKTWQALEQDMHKACGQLLLEAYHETNAWLVERGVLPQVDLRPFIRRSEGHTSGRPQLDGLADGPGTGMSTSVGPYGTQTGAPYATGTYGGASSPYATGTYGGATSPYATGTFDPAQSSALGGGAAGGAGGYTAAASRGAAAAGRLPNLDEETRMLTRPAPAHWGEPSPVGAHFSAMMERHLPGFKDTSSPRAPSQRLAQAMEQVQARVAHQVELPASDTHTDPTPSALLRNIRERHADLKQAASSPAERATIELVALLFQAILTEDRLPASLRVWFARLQMPTLRVAIAEPDFFSSEEHPARRLIDRMGACVMGFEGDADVIGSPLETEIRRVVQVVEAFPDTGRRVFQTVLNEFEKFLEAYFRDHNDTTRFAVSLAEQVEQRETLAIQYTIELRKMLSDVPVQDGVRDFLFHIWADVLATSAVRHGAQSEEVRRVRSAATELLWTAGAKTTREERGEVIRRLPPLLATLRQGMTSAGLSTQRQDESLKSLNLALAAAFGARAVSISDEQLEALKRRLETIEELLPDEDFELDESWVLDEASHEQEGLEVVSDGGSMPGPQMLEMAERLQPGESFLLDYRGRQERVRLVWQGMSKQLTLFNGANGRCVLFQKARLAAFLQAGLLIPAQEESLTTAATRSAISKINADPARLLG
ncbi:DUF1631 family protein [Ideonella sp.]|jgi:hypothetical protein|uniref:DUF1631 family protein n=1 Tax=Ideonella sp. TaxID=1929293 RepID=UPI0037C0077F